MFHSKTEKNSDLRSYSVSVSVAGGGEKKEFFSLSWRLETTPYSTKYTYGAKHDWKWAGKQFHFQPVRLPPGGANHRQYSLPLCLGSVGEYEYFLIFSSTGDTCVRSTTAIVARTTRAWVDPAVVRATESSPDVPKTVNKRPTVEIFLQVPRQLDEAPVKTPFLACNSMILGLPLERSS
jgi:hypothetical protein